jgi:hypothetical protein
MADAVFAGDRRLYFLQRFAYRPQAFQQLMDRELPPEVHQRSRSSGEPRRRRIHDLRTRRSGRLARPASSGLDQDLPLSRANARRPGRGTHSAILRGEVTSQDPVASSDEAWSRSPFRRNLTSTRNDQNASTPSPARRTDADYRAAIDLDRPSNSCVDRQRLAKVREQGETADPAAALRSPGARVVDLASRHQKTSSRGVFS